VNGSVADLLIPVVTAAVMQLPILIAVAVSVVWVLGSPRGHVRNVALWGLGLLGSTSLVGMFANVVPQLLVIQGNYDSLRGISMLMGWVHFGLNLLTALAMVLVVWALTRALRDRGLPTSR